MKHITEPVQYIHISIIAKVVVSWHTEYYQALSSAKQSYQ